MRTLVGQARRRLFHNQLANQGVHAAAAVLAFVILLLLLGAGLVDWRWILPVALLAAGAAFYRAHRRRPSPYAAAQIVDQRLALADTLSTAVYFQQELAGSTSPAICQWQRERAERLAESLDVRRAVPYTVPRGIYPLAVLLLVAGGLLGLRYGVSGRLDLDAPLARLLRQQFGANEPAETARTLRHPPPEGDGVSTADSEVDPSQPSEAGPNDGAEASSDAGSEMGDGQKGGKRGGKPSAGDEEAQAESGPPPAGGESAQEAGKQERKPPSAGKPEAGSGQNASLMDKAKDVFRNLLSSLQAPSGNAAGPQHAGESPNQQGGQPTARNDKNGQQQNGGETGDSDAGPLDGQGQNPRDQPENGDGRKEAQQVGKKPGSGGGSQEGDKRLQQAEDLAAMGKIAEILGRRSSGVTGEATVEVESTSQQLRTPYAPRGGQHGQSGGEIDRDEIPVAMEPYVQQYFEQVRRQAAPAAKKR